jgi:zinc protease
LNLLAQCLSERLRIKIREELGAAYSPYAYYAPSEAYRGAGAIQASLGVAPDQTDRVAKAALDLADALVASGIDDALLDQVKTPLVKGLAARKQRNDWWLTTVMPRLATQPFRLTWAKGLESDIQSITAVELSALAKRFLVRDQALVVIGTATP